MAKTKAAQIEPNYIVMPLLALALATNLFLYMVSYTQATFNSQAFSFPNIVQSNRAVAMLDQQIDQVQADIANSFSQVGSVVGPAAVAFLGLDGYRYGMAPIQTSLAPRSFAEAASAPSMVQSINDSHGAVLGIMIINPEYASQYSQP